MVSRRGSDRGALGTGDVQDGGPLTAQLSVDAPKAVPPAVDDVLVQDGGVVVARRPAGFGQKDGGRLDESAPRIDAVANGDSVRKEISLDDDVAGMVSASQPVVTPRAVAVKSINCVLAAVIVRKEVRGALEQLVCYGLPCFSVCAQGQPSIYPTVCYLLTTRSLERLCDRFRTAGGPYGKPQTTPPGRCHLRVRFRFIPIPATLCGSRGGRLTSACLASFNLFGS